MLANVQLNLQAAYKQFFDRKHGFPKLKSAKHSRKSYITNNQKGTVAFTEKGIRPPNVGEVKAKLHRMPEETWELKSAAVSLESDGKYYVSVLFAYDKENPAVSIDPNTALGLDDKSDGLYMDSEGEKYATQTRLSIYEMRDSGCSRGYLTSKNIRHAEVGGGPAEPAVIKRQNACGHCVRHTKYFGILVRSGGRNRKLRLLKSE